MNFTPQDDYDGLLAQAKAMHRIIEVMEKSKSIQGKAVDDLTRQLLACGKDQLESEREVNQMLTDQVLRLEQECDHYKDEMKEVKAQLPPVENGKNRYGLDVSYFRNLINRELNRGLTDYKPDELARICLRMAMTADKMVINEREFTSRMNLAEHDAEVIESALYSLSDSFRYDFEGCYGLSEVEEFIDNYINQLRQKEQEIDK